MTSRILPQAEWSRLAGTEAETVWPLLDPNRSQVIVVEDEAGLVIGCWVLMLVAHAECLWIAPSARKRASVARRLWLGLHRAAASMGVTTIATAALTDDVRDLLQHVGAMPLPGEHFVFSIPREDVVCQPS